METSILCHFLKFTSVTSLEFIFFPLSSVPQTHLLVDFWVVASLKKQKESVLSMQMGPFVKTDFLFFRQLQLPIKASVQT